MERILITGAGRGLGLALVRQALERGHRVCACPRSAARSHALEALAQPRLSVLPLDVSCPDQIARAPAAVAALFSPIDLLINNAGVHAESPNTPPPATSRILGQLEGPALQTLLQINAIGPLLVCQALAGLLEPSPRPRVINVSSRKASLSNTHSGGNYGYPASKAALNMFTRLLAADLAPRGIVVVAVHPGQIQTAMGGPQAPLSPTEAAQRLLALAQRLDTSHSGRFLNTDGSALPW